MRILAWLGFALAIGWMQPATAACITNNTGAALYVDQYSLVTEEDIFRIEPGQRQCRHHSGLFNRYDVGLIPYESVDSACTTYLARDADELVIEGRCDQKNGKKCMPQIKCGHIAKVSAATEHAAVP